MPKKEVEKPIEALTMTPAEKRAYALSLLQETDPQVLKAIEIAEQERDMQAKLDMAQADEEKRQRNEPHWWIEINRQGPDDKETVVFVGAAGVSYNIQKDIPVPVPQSVLNVLDNAVIQGWVPIVDEAKGVKYARKMKYKRYPYSRLNKATPEEVAAFRARQEEIRKANEDITFGQEMSQLMRVQESMEEDKEPFVPAYMREVTTGPTLGADNQEE